MIHICYSPSSTYHHLVLLYVFMISLRYILFPQTTCSDTRMSLYRLIYIHMIVFKALVIALIVWVLDSASSIITPCVSSALTGNIFEHLNVTAINSL